MVQAMVIVARRVVNNKKGIKNLIKFCVARRHGVVHSDSESSSFVNCPSSTGWDLALLNRCLQSAFEELH